MNDGVPAAQDLMATCTYEDIAGKAEWEGGLDEALDWFKPEEVPEEIRAAWQEARDIKAQLKGKLDQINAFLPEG